jgi:hypothetical protein
MIMGFGDFHDDYLGADVTHPVVASLDPLSSPVAERGDWRLAIRPILNFLFALFPPQAKRGPTSGQAMSG